MGSKVVLVETIEPQRKIISEELFNEFRLLIETLSFEIVVETSQVIKDVNFGYFIGKGKVEEIKQIVRLTAANYVFIDASLTYLQLKNLTREIGVPCIDRPRLILMIFSKRAKTAEGKIEVELSELKMRLPEIVHSDTNLDQQTASLMGLKGPGERKTELKRRYIEKRIQSLEDKLKVIKKNREERRKKRKKSGVPLVAIVGYTNSGKSTIMNRLSSVNDAYVEDMPFATLDTLVRDTDFGDNFHVLLIDTIGFIRDLPHSLIYSFHSTLEEILDAWLLLNVTDISDANFPEKMQTVAETVEELGAKDIPVINVFNKTDKVSEDTLNELKCKFKDAVFVSALKGDGISDLKSAIESMLGKSLVRENIFIPSDRVDVLNSLEQFGRILSRRVLPTGFVLEVEAPLKELKSFSAYFIKSKE
ncbi:MAG: GTPase HflX [Caldisericaceae bacterium]